MSHMGRPNMEYYIVESIHASHEETLVTVASLKICSSMYFCIV